MVVDEYKSNTMKVVKNFQNSVLKTLFELGWKREINKIFTIIVSFVYFSYTSLSSLHVSSLHVVSYMCHKKVKELT